MPEYSRCFGGKHCPPTERGASATGVAPSHSDRSMRSGAPCQVGRTQGPNSRFWWFSGAAPGKIGCRSTLLGSEACGGTWGVALRLSDTRQMGSSATADGQLPRNPQPQPSAQGNGPKMDHASITQVRLDLGGIEQHQAGPLGPCLLSSGLACACTISCFS